jgi:type IV pilus assembly protein PilC
MSNKTQKPINNAKVRLKPIEKLSLIGNLSTMISAGIPILSAIHSLAQEGRGNMKIILETIYADLLHGSRVYSSFEKFPEVFDPVTISMVQAAEESGTLATVLQDIREQIKKDIAFNRKVRGALTYPALVMLIFFAILGMILVVVIPKIATVFSQLKVTIPLPTKILIFSSDALLHYPLYIIAGLSLIIGGIVFLFKKKRKKMLKLIHAIPVISQVVKEIDLYRFSRSLHLLLTSGISITTALGLTKNVVVNAEVAAAIGEAQNAVLSGSTLSSVFKERRNVFPGTMIELTQAGESTGTLDTAMHNVSEYLDYKITDTIAFLTALLEPVMLILVAIVVCMMMVAIIGPIYNLIGQIGSH